MRNGVKKRWENHLAMEERHAKQKERLDEQQKKEIKMVQVQREASAQKNEEMLSGMCKIMQDILHSRTQDGDGGGVAEGSSSSGVNGEEQTSSLSRRPGKRVRL
eukprot:GHVU01074138.1.p1 GENE.GHVU01074138.1~~GHVU01074138.1.p1  ORF type:complete len:104 (+),score=28.50 GHVU01074138.1:673-984(+)